MNRSARRHRSTKVPNVKLRPAPSKAGERHDGTEEERAELEAMQHYHTLRVSHAAGKRKADRQSESNGVYADEREESDGEEDGDEEDEDGEEDEEDDCAPLAGCTICTTGFEEEKVRLQECIVALGAKMEGDLTESATHLVAKEVGSDKYYCAIKLGIPVMRPSWLYDLRERWQKAKPFAYGAMLEEHRLDAFQGLTMAMAGVTDVERRKQIRNAVKGASGQTPTVFKLDGSFTHLLCEHVKSSETLKAVERFLHKANRYRKRGEDVPDDAADAEHMRAALKLRVVWIEWADDCLRVGGCIDERLYSLHGPRMNASQRDALVKSILSKKTESNKRTTETMKAIQAALKGEASQVRPHAHSSTAKAQNGIVRPLTKRAKTGLSDLVQSIAQGMETVKPAQLAAESPLPDPVEETGVEPAKSPMNAPVELLSRQDVTMKQNEGEEEMELDERSGLNRVSVEKSLKDVSFRVDLRDPLKNDRVLQALRDHGIRNLFGPDDSQKADFHILPLAGAKANDELHLGQPVTHFFIERCMMEDRVIGLDEAFALQPSHHTFPISDHDTVRIAVTGLGSNETGPDRHQIQMILDLTGIKYDSVFKRGVHTHLLVGKSAVGSSSSDAKIERAKKWGVPIVGLEFVDTLFREGTIPSQTPKDHEAEKDSRIADAKGDVHTVAQDASLMLEETQINGAKSDTELATEKRKEENNSRPHAKSDSKVPSTDRARSDAQRTQPVLVETQFKQSLVGTQVYDTSSEHVMNLLTNELLFDGKSANVIRTNGATKNAGGRRVRRLPPSKRDRFRRSSRTPTVDDRGTSVTSDVSDAEQMLNNGHKSEDRLMFADAQQSFEDDEDEQNARVVYDDPAARRERRKIAAMIDKTIEIRRENDSDANDSSPEKAAAPTSFGPRQYVKARSESTSPLKQVHTASGRFSPSIKARRQPGTANREI